MNAFKMNYLLMYLNVDDFFSYFKIFFILLTESKIGQTKNKIYYCLNLYYPQCLVLLYSATQPIHVMIVAHVLMTRHWKASGSLFFSLE